MIKIGTPPSGIRSFIYSTTSPSSRRSSSIDRHCDQRVVTSAKVIVSHTPSSPHSLGKTAAQQDEDQPPHRAIIVVTLMLSTDWK